MAPPLGQDPAEGAQLAGGPPFRSSRVPQYGATIVVDILHFIYGLSIGWSAVVLPVLTGSGGAGADNGTSGAGNASSTVDDDGGGGGGLITLEQASWLASVVYISAALPMPLYSVACERLGRKRCGYLIGAPYVVSALLQALATSFAGVLAARALLGFASAGIFILAPLYVSEIAEDAVRGRLGAFLMLMRNAGILTAYALGTVLSHKQFEWACVAPPVLFLLCFRWMPETPMHLLRQGREAEAARALRWLRGRRADVASELLRLKASLAATRSAAARSASLRDLFATRGSRRAVCIGLLMSCNQQLCGFFGVVSYTFMIFGEASPALLGVSNVIVGTMLVLGIAVSMMIYDKIDRKVLLLVSNALMISSLLVLSAYFYYKDAGEDVSSYGWLPVTAMSVYVVGYSTGAAALPIVILTEMFSPKVRNLGLTTNGMFTWSIIFIVTKTFPMMVKEIGFHGSCWVYTCWCLMGVVVILTILPETRNRPLESILDELQNGKKKTKVEETDKQGAEKSLMNHEKREKDEECTL